MRRLEEGHELLDGPLDERVLAANLRDLARINRWLGGTDLSERAIAPLALNNFVLSILDVGTGGADIPLSLARDGREITATDIRPEIVAAAAISASRGRVTVREGALSDESDASFDVVHASLVIHHLDPGGSRVVPGGHEPRRSPGGDRQRPRPWLALVGGCMAADAPGHAQRVHAPRRTAIRASRVHREGDGPDGATGRAAARRPLCDSARVPLRARLRPRAEGAWLTEVDVAIVGGGPAGAALAIRLATLGYATAVLERRPFPEWHACGVFSSPRTRRRLGDLGFSRDKIADLSRPISALALRTAGGATCRIEYTHGHACGFDRVRLDAALLDAARHAGADVRNGVVVRNVDLDAQRGANRLMLSPVAGPRAAQENDSDELVARLVVGADGGSSVVSRAAGAHRTRGWFRRIGVTFHRHDLSAAPEGSAMEGSFFFGRGWYAGIAPVPGARVNVGMVLPYEQARRDPLDFAERALAAVPTNEAWHSAPTMDRPAVAGRLEHHAARVAGPGWLLVGDAIGFVDPLTGEGLQRAFVSAELAADHVARLLRGDSSAAADYDRRVKHRFAGKNVLSWMLQLFLWQPAAFDYALRRLAARPRLREELTLVLTDQQRASTALSPAFLAELLQP